MRLNAVHKMAIYTELLMDAIQKIHSIMPKSMFPHQLCNYSLLNHKIASHNLTSQSPVILLLKHKKVLFRGILLASLAPND